VIFVGLDWSDAGLTRPEAVRTYARPRARRFSAALQSRGTTIAAEVEL
jgi:hypothetical protein